MKNIILTVTLTTKTTSLYTAMLLKVIKAHFTSTHSSYKIRKDKFEAFHINDNV